MLKAASLSAVWSERAFLPHGKLCKTQHGVNGASLTEFEPFSRENFAMIIKTLINDRFDQGKLVVGGRKVKTEEEKQRIAGEFREILEGGTLLTLSQWIAQKI